MPYIAIIGLEWGDEGKGKIISALKDEFDIVVRFQGGSNAGHTVYINNKKIVFHQLPSGLIHEDKTGILGPYEVIDLELLLKEIEEMEKFGLKVKERIYIDERCPLVLPYHKFIDELEEEKTSIGTTKRGIGPAYSDFVRRKGVRICDLKNERDFNERFKNSFNFNKVILGGEYGQVPPDKNFIIKNLRENFEKIKERVIDTIKFLYEKEKEGKRILIEGAQGTLLDIIFGTYPYVTSSFTTAGGASACLGIPPYKIKRIIGVLKSYTTRVGKGPFPTEFKDEMQNIIREKGEEYGATTLRPRRCGWLDLVISKYSCIINGVNEIALTKIDVLSNIEKIKICIEYEIDGERINFPPVGISNWFKIKPIYRVFDGFEIKEDFKKYDELPLNLKKIIDFIEEYLEIPIKIISIGKEKSKIIYK
jgi:adenylosuccinate synthase